jgi:uncharacterized protein (TIGR00369 family)
MAAHDADETDLPPGTGLLSFADVTSQAGIDLLAAIRDGRVPHPPITGVLDFRFTEIEPGRVVVTGYPARRHYNPIGTVHGGWIATLLDSCMGCAVHTTLKAGEAYTSLEIKVNYVKPVMDRTGPVRAIGRLTSRGRRVGTAEGQLVDANGSVLALGTTTCLIFPAAEAGSRARG